MELPALLTGTVPGQLPQFSRDWEISWAWETGAVPRNLTSRSPYPNHAAGKPQSEFHGSPCLTPRPHFFPPCFVRPTSNPTFWLHLRCHSHLTLQAPPPQEFSLPLKPTMVPPCPWSASPKHPESHFQISRALPFLVLPSTTTLVPDLQPETPGAQRFLCLHVFTRHPTLRCIL